MRLAAGGAPIAVKRRAVEISNKVKILPVQSYNVLNFYRLIFK
jgi:hypothetical protein